MRASDHALPCCAHLAHHLRVEHAERLVRLLRCDPCFFPRAGTAIESFTVATTVTANPGAIEVSLSGYRCAVGLIRRALRIGLFFPCLPRQNPLCIAPPTFPTHQIPSLPSAQVPGRTAAQRSGQQSGSDGAYGAVISLEREPACGRRWRGRWRSRGGGMRGCGCPPDARILASHAGAAAAAASAPLGDVGTMHAARETDLSAHPRPMHACNLACMSTMFARIVAVVVKYFSWFESIEVEVDCSAVFYDAGRLRTVSWPGRVASRG